MKKIIFLHPDFGIGGAERLVLDAALAIKSRGHVVRIVTNQFSQDHCFSELLEFKEDMEVVGQKIPRAIFGRFHALLAYIRICWAALLICYNHPDADVVFCDLISAPLPILRILTKASLLFYCHFPDQKLTTRDTFWKKLYRLVIDQIESWTMLFADEILVNSHFTEGVVRDTFPALVDRPLTVLYPSINCAFFDQQLASIEEEGESELLASEFGINVNDDFTLFVSINRFERKKCIELAIHSFDYFCKNLVSADKAKESILIIAGGYDPMNAENIAYYDELVALTESLDLKENVLFVKSPSDRAKILLMYTACLLIYTPDREHFGIVPVEAMYMSAPVLAVKSGGPMETVVDEKTGFLCYPDPKSFANAMWVVVDDPSYAEELGMEGHQHVEENFSFAAFTDKLDAIIGNMHRRDQKDESSKKEESTQ